MERCRQLPAWTPASAGVTVEVLPARGWKLIRYRFARLLVARIRAWNRNYIILTYYILTSGPMRTTI